MSYKVIYCRTALTIRVIIDEYQRLHLSVCCQPCKGKRPDVVDKAACLDRRRSPYGFDPRSGIQVSQKQKKKN